MGFWIFFPIILSMVSFIGTWSVYGLASSNDHVCSLYDWGNANFCQANQSTGCCHPPTISSSGVLQPENSLFTATINAGAFLFLLFSIFHHAHIMEEHACHSMISKIALVFGVISSMGAFIAGNCNANHLKLLHYLGAAVSFICICFYTSLLTALTRKCVLSGYEKFLFPLRMASTMVQIIMTICYIIFFTKQEYVFAHLSAVFEWTVSVNFEMFQLSYAVEFFFFSSFMISNVLGKREEESSLMMA
ncbi:transmembrane protein 150A [Pholidichthys leucotaenia]